MLLNFYSGNYQIQSLIRKNKNRYLKNWLQNLKHQKTKQQTNNNLIFSWSLFKCIYISNLPDNLSIIQQHSFLSVSNLHSIIDSMLGATVVKPNYYPWNTFLFWYAICFFIMFFPFLVCNLYYAYHDSTCVDFDPPPFANGIKMSLNQWFQADAYIMLGFIVFFLLIGIGAWCWPELACSYGWWEGLHVLYILWRLAWLIVGSVLFWKGLEGLCANNVRRYTFAMLIIGYVWLFVELFLAFGYPRPVPYPVSVPVGTGLRTSAVVAPIGVTSTPFYRPGGIVY